jgi:cleavage and polyadenylation specificity factor subunit 2
MFNFTPLLGAQSASIASQSLLELDGGVKVLVDVGWDSAFDVNKLQALEKHVSSLSLILLTHATIDHIGAYAHCCKHVPSFNKIPVYATTPVINLGRNLLTDLYSAAPLLTSVLPSSAISTALSSDPTDSSSNILLPCPTAEEIASYFHAINPLKYSQPHQPIPSSFSPPVGNLTITAYSAGHTLGGTIWHLQHSLESIVYAVDWNQGRENLLSGAAWLGGAGAEIIEPLRRPTALICSSKGVQKSETISRKKRDEQLVSLVRDTIAQGGKVLIPTDSSARVLELAFVLNHTWRENIGGPHGATYKDAKVFMASKTSASTIKQLPSMLEWMDDAIIRDAEAAMNKDKGDDKVLNLLDWPHVKRIERRSQFDRVLRRSQPSVLLAGDASLEWGFARQALESLAGDSRNLIILTELALAQEETGVSTAQQLARFLEEIAHRQNTSGAKLVDLDGQQLQLRTAATEVLAQDEELLHQHFQARQRQLHSNLQGDNAADDTAMAEIADDQASDDSESEDENEDPEHQGRALNASAQLTQSNKRKVGLTEAELGINVLLRSKHIHDYDVRNKRGREKMFPFIAHRQKADDFGDIIKPEEYLRAEERDDVDGVDMKSGAVKQESLALGQKRKWDDSRSGNSKDKRVNKETPNKKSRLDRPPDDIDALIARATGENGEGGAAANTTRAGSESDEDSESDYEPDDDSNDVPKKVVFTSRTLSLRLQVAYVDFSGLHERRDLQMLIPLIQPRKLILTSGNASETRALADECKQLLAGGNKAVEILTPVNGKTVDASVDTNAWTLKLGRSLVKKLLWQNVKGLGIVALTARLDVEALEEPASNAAAADENVKKKMRLIKGETEENESELNEDTPKEPAQTNALTHQNPLPSIPILDALDSTTSNSLTPSSTHHRLTTQPVHVGDLRLVDLRRMMLASGHTVEFRGEGTLLIDSTVVVRKSASGRIEVEAGAGGLSLPPYRTKEGMGSFYAVRAMIYEGLAVVAGV